MTRAAYTRWDMPDHRPRVRALIDAHTLNKAARQLRMAPQTIAKYVGGLPITEATELLIDARMNEYVLAHGEPVATLEQTAR